MATRNSYTGSPSTDALLPHATALISAVHDQDPTEVAEILADATAVAGDVLTAAHGLAVILAAMVPEQHTVAELLAWTMNPPEYRRLRDEGVNSLTAGALAASSARGGVAA